jgi:hypothetical protein
MVRRPATVPFFFCTASVNVSKCVIHSLGITEFTPNHLQIFIQTSYAMLHSKSICDDDSTLSQPLVQFVAVLSKIPRINNLFIYNDSLIQIFLILIFDKSTYPISYFIYMLVCLFSFPTKVKLKV